MMQKRESPEFRFPEVGISGLSRIFSKSENQV